MEDCAQSLGGVYRGKPLGSWGAASGSSRFTPRRSSRRDRGGWSARTTPDLSSRVRDSIRYDERTDDHTALAFEMTSFQAALGTSQMARIDDFLKRRLAIYDFYSGDLPLGGHRACAARRPGRGHPLPVRREDRRRTETDNRRPCGARALPPGGRSSGRCLPTRQPESCPGPGGPTTGTSRSPCTRR